LRVRRETTIKQKATLRWWDSWGDLFAALPLTSRLTTRGRPLGVVSACCASSGWTPNGASRPPWNHNKAKGHLAVVG